MPSLTPEQLQAARKASGRLGGRPRKPTIDEARRESLRELVPEAVRVLEQSLRSDDERLRLAAAREVFDRSGGRPPQRIESHAPTVAERLGEMAAEQLDELAREALEALGAAEGPPEVP